MPRALLVLAPQFEDIEAIATADVLHRSGVEVVSVALDRAASATRQVCSDHSLLVVANKAIEDVRGQLFDAIIFPGGLKATQFINQSPDAEALCKAHMAAGKLVCAICAAPAVALGSWGVLKGRRVVHYPSLPKKSEEYLGPEVEYVADPAVHVLVDGNVITSRGPGTALEFGLAIATALRGDRVAHEVKAGMLA